MPWTNASIVLNSRDATAGNYNNLKFNATGQNIIQGQIHSIAVNEVNYPYDIPNIQSGFNKFRMVNNAIEELRIEITPGFYTGLELATAINNEMIAQGAAGSPTISPANLPTFTYDDASNTFKINPPSAPSADNNEWLFRSPWTFPNGYPPPAGLGKDIFSIMGFTQDVVNPAVVSTSPPLYVNGGSAPLLFTQYIDICSPLLCQYQNFRDGSTTNLARRSDVICRLYISNNVATQEDEGTRPFVINRQFMNARIMKWNAESSVGQLDIALFDDCGQPLSTVWSPRPYQITFNCYEADSVMGGMGDDDKLPELLKKFATYTPRNQMGWNSPNYPMR